MNGRRGGSTMGQGATAPHEKCGSPVPPPHHFGPTSLDFLLNRPVISLIQLHIVPLRPLSWNCGPHCPHLASARTAPEQGPREPAGSKTYFCIFHFGKIFWALLGNWFPVLLCIHGLSIVKQLNCLQFESWEAFYSVEFHRFFDSVCKTNWGLVSVNVVVSFYSCYNRATAPNSLIMPENDWF